MDISSVNMAFHCRHNEKKIERVLIAAGGLAAAPIRMKKTEDLLKGKQLSDQLINEAIKMASQVSAPK